MVEINLIIDCQKGTQSAFEQLYETCSTKVLRTIYSITNRRDLAEDIMQEAFYECCRDIGKLQAPEAFELWFYRIIVRVCWRVLSNERKALHEQLDDCEASLKDPENYFDRVENNVITDAVNHQGVSYQVSDLGNASTDVVKKAAESVARYQLEK